MYKGDAHVGYYPANLTAIFTIVESTNGDGFVDRHPVQPITYHQHHWFAFAFAHIHIVTFQLQHVLCA